MSPGEELKKSVEEFQEIFSSSNEEVATYIDRRMYHVLDNEDDLALEYQEKLVEMIKMFKTIKNKDEMEIYLEDLMGYHYSVVTLYERRAYQCGFMDGYTIKERKGQK